MVIFKYYYIIAIITNLGPLHNMNDSLLTRHTPFSVCQLVANLICEKGPW